MKKSTSVAIVVVCLGITAAALWSIKAERRRWITPGVGRTVPPPGSSPNVATGVSSTNAGETPTSHANIESSDRQNVQALLKSNPTGLSGEQLELVDRVVKQRGSGPDDGASEMRMALALAGDKKLLASAVPEQAARMKAIVIGALNHPVWRMRRVAIGICSETGWLEESAVRDSVINMQRADPAIEVRLTAKRAMEQREKAAARNKPSGGP